MKQNIYSIYDTASGLYSRPFFTLSDAEAIRSFTDICTDAEHPIGKHPEDYTLLRIGIFDDLTALLNNEANESLCTALERIAATRDRSATRDNLELFDKNIGKAQGTN